MVGADVREWELNPPCNRPAAQISCCECLDGGTPIAVYVMGTADLRFMSLVGNCKFNYFAAQMTTHGAAWMLEVNSVVTLV